MAIQNRRNLPQFDPETADLDLIVGAAEILDVAVLIPAGEISRVVKALAVQS